MATQGACGGVFHSSWVDQFLNWEIIFSNNVIILTLDYFTVRTMKAC